jgi:predicted transcriptional regulator
VAKRRGADHGRQKGTTKARPGRARPLRDQGLSVAEIAKALTVSDRTVFLYLADEVPAPR